jgi:hypothetical protein
MERTPAYHTATPAFDWIMGVLATLVVAGVFQDGCAHNHGLVDQSFFTPWHAILYGTMAVTGLVLLGYGLLNLRRGHRFREGLPYGYWLCATGVALFLFGGLLDLWWHAVFGIEEDINALVSPTHLLLALAAAFVISGPIRSVARRVCADAPARWRDAGPVILASASLLSLMAFFTMYANPIGATDAVTVIGKSNRLPVVGNVYAMRPDGSQQTRLTASTASDEFGVTVSPDGKTLAYRAALGANKAEIFLARSDGRTLRQLTHTGGWASQPAWSPDGKHIAFVVVPVGSSGEYQLMTIAPNGTRARVLLRSVAEIVAPAWSADSSSIVYSTRNGLTTQLARIAASGGTAHFIAGTQGATFPAISRNGTLAFASAAGICVGSCGRAVAVPGATMPAFSPRGDMLAYVFTKNGANDIGVVRLTRSGAPTDLTNLSGMYASRPAWSPDGRIYYTAAANGSILDTDIAQAFAVDTFLISSVLIMGALLVLIRRFHLPVGAITVLIAIYAVEQATQQDHYFAILPAIGAAVVADVSIAMVRLREGPLFYAFAFAFSCLFTAVSIAAINAQTGGLGWPPDLTFGTPVLAGFAGLLIAFCCAIPLPAPASSPATETTPEQLEPQPVLQPFA